MRIRDPIPARVQRMLVIAAFPILGQTLAHPIEESRDNHRDHDEEHSPHGGTLAEVEKLDGYQIVRGALSREPVFTY